MPLQSNTKQTQCPPLFFAGSRNVCTEQLLPNVPINYLCHITPNAGGRHCHCRCNEVGDDISKRQHHHTSCPKISKYSFDESCDFELLHEMDGVVDNVDFGKCVDKLAALTLPADDDVPEATDEQTSNGRHNILLENKLMSIKTTLQRIKSENAGNISKKAVRKRLKSINLDITAKPSASASAATKTIRDKKESGALEMKQKYDDEREMTYRRPNRLCVNSRKSIIDELPFATVASRQSFNRAILYALDKTRGHLRPTITA